MFLIVFGFANPRTDFQNAHFYFTLLAAVIVRWNGISFWFPSCFRTVRGGNTTLERNRNQFQGSRSGTHFRRMARACPRSRRGRVLESSTPVLWITSV